VRRPPLRQELVLPDFYYTSRRLWPVKPRSIRRCLPKHLSIDDRATSGGATQSPDRPALLPRRREAPSAPQARVDAPWDRGAPAAASFSGVGQPSAVESTEGNRQPHLSGRNSDPYVREIVREAKNSHGGDLPKCPQGLDLSGVFAGAARGIRTPDPVITNDVLEGLVDEVERVSAVGEGAIRGQRDSDLLRADLFHNRSDAEMDWSG
jgi:hypothetical protein